MIKITKQNQAKIEAVLDKVQSRCKARLAGFDDVVRAVQLAEANPVVAILPKADHIGIEGIYKPGHGGAIANSYKGVPTETHITIERRASGWFFLKAMRCKCVHSERINLYVPAMALTEAKHRFAALVNPKP